MSFLNFLKPKKSHSERKIASVECPAGFNLPESIDQILSKHSRPVYLQTLWDYSSLPKETYELFYIEPLHQLLHLMQEFPASNTRTSVFCRTGGLADRTLMLVSYSAKIAKQYLLPIGATPEEQAAQSTAWHALIIYKALFESLRPLSSIYVETSDGKPWRPYKPIDEPFRFRFTDHKLAEDNLVFNQLLSSDFLNWITRWPNVYEIFLQIANDNISPTNIVSKIVLEAHALIDPNVELNIYKTIKNISPNSSINCISALDETSVPSNVELSEASHVALPIQSKNGDSHTIPGNKPIDNDIPSLLSAFDEEGKVDLREDGSESDINHSFEVSSTSDEDDLMKQELINLFSPSPKKEAQNQESTEGDTLKPTQQAAEILPSKEDKAYDNKESHITIKSSSKDIGKKFIDWLANNIADASLTINEPTGFIHVSSGYLLIKSPNIFTRYIRATDDLSNDDRKMVQSGFEKLNIHKKDGKSIFTATMRLSDGNIMKINGYLIPLSYFLEKYIHLTFKFDDNPKLLLH